MISAQRARLWIALPWISIFAVIFLGLTVNTFSGSFCAPGEMFCAEATAIWDWFAPATLPTTGLIIGALAVDALSPNRREQTAKPYFILTLALSALYLVVVLVIVYAAVLGYAKPADLGIGQTLIVGPLQGVVSAALGIFYYTATPEPSASPSNQP
jgi:hypothetical protein